MSFFIPFRGEAGGQEVRETEVSSCCLGGGTTGNDRIIRREHLTGNKYSVGRIARRQPARHC